MYIETSNPIVKGDIARLVSPLQEYSDGQNCALEFWYHMYGENIATLNVYQRSAGVDNTSALLWSLSGNQLDTWHLAYISLTWSQPFAFKVLFELIIHNL